MLYIVLFFAGFLAGIIVTCIFMANKELKDYMDKGYDAVMDKNKRADKRSLKEKFKTNYEIAKRMEDNKL